ncbi:MAG: hydrolase 1, exosortase A system-associated [Lysobacterales bacterium]|jgi:exosortase A-associated hydrolase 1
MSTANVSGSPEPFEIPLGDARLAAMLHRGDARAAVGVLIVVGGPQYRVGAHRQFLLLARRLAAAGIPCLRFDLRGMGDSSGEAVDFLTARADIEAAIAAFKSRCPALRGIVAWGLCDGAAAILLHVATHPDIAGLVLLNPWVRQEHTLAQSLVRHYYWNRLRSREFWRKLLRGGVDLGRAARGVLGALRLSRDTARGERQAAAVPTAANFVARMATQWQASGVPSLVLLSSEDLVAAEFRQLCANEPQWRALVQRPQVRCTALAGADHTCSSAAFRATVETETLAFVQALSTTRASP